MSAHLVSRCASVVLRVPAGLAQAGRRTYISPFSNRFFKFSLMASFEILLISVRSETPTSFFLVVSKTAFVANWDLGAVRAAGWPPTALRAARLVFPYTGHALAGRRCVEQAWRGTMVDARCRAGTVACVGQWWGGGCVYAAAAVRMQQRAGRQASRARDALVGVLSGGIWGAAAQEGVGVVLAAMARRDGDQRQRGTDKPSVGLVGMGPSSPTAQPQASARRIAPTTVRASWPGHGGITRPVSTPLHLARPLSARYARPTLHSQSRRCCHGLGQPQPSA